MQVGIRNDGWGLEVYWRNWLINIKMGEMGEFGRLSVDFGAIARRGGVGKCRINASALIRQFTNCRILANAQMLQTQVSGNAIIVKITCNPNCTISTRSNTATQKRHFPTLANHKCTYPDTYLINQIIKTFNH